MVRSKGNIVEILDDLQVRPTQTVVHDAQRLSLLLCVRLDIV